MDIEFPTNWNDLESFEISSKGWLGGVRALAKTGDVFELTFYDPVRLSQGIEDEHKSGKIGFVERGLIVVPEVTKQNIELAIEQAEKEGYFEKNI